jgi:hypothetical protein
VAATRVHDPFRGDFDLIAAGLLDCDAVAGVAAQLELRDARRPPDLGALLGGDFQEVLVQLGPVELKRRSAGELGRPDLGGFAQAGDPVVDEPVPERLLGKLLAGEVIVLFENAGQEIRGDLDRRFSDLPVEPVVLLGDEDLQLRHPALEQDRRRGSRHRPADDDDVVFHALSSLSPPEERPNARGQEIRQDHRRDRNAEDRTRFRPEHDVDGIPYEIGSDDADGENVAPAPAAPQPDGRRHAGR